MLSNNARTASVKKCFIKLSKVNFEVTSDTQQKNIVLGAGCNAVLENLCFCLADQFFLESDASTTHAQCPRTKLTGVPIDKNSD